MNAEAAEPSALGKLTPPGERPRVGSPPGDGWSRRKFYSVIFLALLAHLALIFIFGAKKSVAPRVVGFVPQLQIANAANELIALGDPTLFVLPHANDFASVAWLRPPVITPPSFIYTEPPRFLPLPVEKLGATFGAFMQTNRFAEFQFNFKPEPPLAGADLVFESPLPQQSTLRVAGELVSRPLLNQISVPSLPVNDVLRSTRVQVLVDASGNVVSAVLLESSENNGADQTALQLARTARFAPAEQLAFGQLIFHWHTIPTAPP